MSAAGSQKKKSPVTGGTSKSQLAHARTEKRKARRREIAAARQNGNVIMRKAGELTPWEAACLQRSRTRAAGRKTQKGEGGGQS